MKKRLKIAYFLDNFYPQINGVVTSSINTAFEMARRDHEVYGVVPTPFDGTDPPEGYFPFSIQYHKGFQAFFYPDFSFTNPFSFKLQRVMKKFQPDIIHFHAPLTLGYQAITTARKLKVPVVGTFHTFFAEPEYLSVVGMEESQFLQDFGWWYSNQYFDRCHAVVSPGIETSQFLTKKGLQNKVHIVSNGVEVKKYQNYQYNSKQFPISVKDDEEWLLYVGRISKEKCMDVLLESMKIISKKRPQTKCLIVGDGPYKKELEQKSKEIGLSERVVFSGPVPNKDLLESGILKKMKLFTSASTSENQPMTIIEAIMFGLPIVGVDAKGIPELIEGNGLIFPPENPPAMAESILKVLTDKKLHKKFSQKSLELAPKYDIANTSDKMEQLYYNTIEEYNWSFKKWVKKEIKKKCVN